MRNSINSLQLSFTFAHCQQQSFQHTFRFSLKLVHASDLNHRARVYLHEFFGFGCQLGAQSCRQRTAYHKRKGILLVFGVSTVQRTVGLVEEQNVGPERFLAFRTFGNLLFLYDGLSELFIRMQMVIAAPDLLNTSMTRIILVLFFGRFNMKIVNILSHKGYLLSSRTQGF